MTTSDADLAKQWLQQAIGIAGRNDVALWERNVGERARVAAIHFALRAIVEQTSPRWSVDAEYNKLGTELKPQGGKTLVTKRPRTGTPDITIHQRGDRGKQSNLLVVEFKRTYSNLEDRSIDIGKIEYWAKEVGYCVGAVVGLGPNGSTFAPKVRWFDGTSWSPRQPMS